MLHNNIFKIFLSHHDRNSTLHFYDWLKPFEENQLKLSHPKIIKFRPYNCKKY